MKVRNPKTGKVLKNPELFIRRLQWELRSEKASVRYFRAETQRLRGKEIVNWTEHTKIQRTSNTNNLFPLNPSDKIAIVGQVVSVKASKCRAGNKESEIEYTVLQTRRMPQDW